MSRQSWGLAAALAALVVACPDRASAQIGGTGVGADPFSFYFGYYLPHQAYIAAQPTPLDTINQLTAARQAVAQTDRAGLYDPVSPYGADDLDPLKPYSRQGGAGQTGRAYRFTHGAANTTSRGSGPPLYYNRTAQYFPTLTAGRGPNRNLTAGRYSRGASGFGIGGSGGGGGGGGMGGGGMGGIGGFN